LRGLPTNQIARSVCTVSRVNYLTIHSGLDDEPNEAATMDYADHEHKPRRPATQAAAGNDPRDHRSTTAHSRGSHQANGSAAGAPVDAWVVLETVLRRWPWLLLAASLSAALFGYLGWKVIQPKFTATARLLRFETPGESDFFTSHISAETFAGLIRSPELLRQVGEHATPPIPPERLVKLVKIEPEPDSDLISMAFASRDPVAAVTLLNFYASNAVTHVRRWYADRAETVAKEYLKKELEQMDRDIAVLDQKLRDLPYSTALTNKLGQVSGHLSALTTNLAVSRPSSRMVARQTERLNTALAELDELLVTYTELHPRVREKQALIASLQSQIKSAATNQAPVAAELDMPMSPLETMLNPEFDIVRTKLLSLGEGRVQLASRQRQAELYAENPPGVVQIFAPATMQGVQSNHRRIKIGLATIFGGLVGVGAGLALVLLVEFADGRLKSRDDLRRVTRLPVLATLGNLHAMSPGERSQWAFRAWTMLQGRLSPTANHGLVCGITSSTPGEGRSTWISLLAEAASLTGFRVLTIATRPSSGHLLAEDAEPAQTPEPPETPEPRKPEANGTAHHSSSALTTSVLSSPGQVTDRLTGPDSPPVVHIPLPGWVWNLERRKQWGEALGQWRQIDNLVILVELPPSSVPEAVLLGSNLPNLLWLANSGSARADETRTQLETLRNARCNLVGAVLNREPAIPLRKRFPRWFGCVACLLALGSSNVNLSGQNPIQIAPTPATNGSTAAAPAPVASTNRHLSIVNPGQRAEWQRRLTLGPGDMLNFGLYGQPDLARAEVAIGPDGRVSYLEAQDVLASGLTVDELREALEREVGKYRRAPRVIVTPVSYRSKKYYILGKVMTKGVYTLDRPLTVLEAIARAHGLESGLVDRNLVDLADFQRSFLVRGSKRIPLNFDDLFENGDLAQNIAIEPNDYIYIASADVKEVYVVGEVRLPGPVTYTPNLDIVGAVTARGGFTERAFRARVLVIRGSLGHPESLAVDTHAITDGKGLNFKLRPKDIIFVNSRPFIRVEELADMAATAFIQSVVTSWVGVDVVKPIQ
jgi:protein involved in polysaccharide export with SLBB domain/capsular polysaccharide biosynthesis protein